MSSSVDMTSEEVKKFSDQELRVRLTDLGMDVGPITGTTRALYERKLVQLLTGTRSEFSEDVSQTPPRSPRKSPRQSSAAKKTTPGRLCEFYFSCYILLLRLCICSLILILFADIASEYDAADGYIQAGSITSPRQFSEDSTINLIRPRKPVARAPVEEPVHHKYKTPQSSPFPAANAQFKKRESEASIMDHVLKYALFGIVMVVIIYFISNQDAGNALEHKN